MRSDVHLRLRRLNRHAHRGAFTLIEIMVVILIIAILVGLLLVGITAAKNTVYQSMTIMELDQIQTALTQYKSDNTSYPPSAGEWTTTTATTNSTTGWSNRQQRLATHFRKAFPRMTATFPPASGTPNIYVVTYSAAGAASTTTLDLRNLDAAEAYLFFLNGPPIVTNSAKGKVFSFAGWSQDSANPIDTTAAYAQRTQRKPPLLDIQSAKLADQDNDNWPEYYTYNAKRPVVYFAGNQYTYDNSGTTTGCAYAMATEISGMARPYASRRITDLTDTALNKPDAWMNPNGVQLIVAGMDDLYAEVNTNTVNSVTGPARTFPFTLDGGTMQFRAGEQDNLSNFYGSTLGKAE